MWKVMRRTCRKCAALRNEKCDLGFKTEKKERLVMVMGKEYNMPDVVPLEPCPKPSSQRKVLEYLEDMGE